MSPQSNVCQKCQKPFIGRDKGTIVDGALLCLYCKADARAAAIVAYAKRTRAGTTSTPVENAPVAHTANYDDAQSASRPTSPATRVTSNTNASVPPVVAKPQAQNRKQWVIFSIVGAGLGVFLLVGAICFMFVSRPSTAPSGINGPFHFGLATISTDGMWQLFVFSDSETPVIVNEVYIDGHAANWQTTTMNHGFLDAMAGKKGAKPPNQLAKGEYIAIMSQEKFTQLKIESDKGTFDGTVPSSQWRY